MQTVCRRSRGIQGSWHGWSGQDDGGTLLCNTSCNNEAMPEWLHTALWIALALLIEKWLDYVERPRWLRRKAKRAPKKPHVLIVVKKPKERHD